MSVAVERDRELRRRRHRKKKVRRLRARLEQTRDPEERQRLIAKIRRVSRYAPVPES
ncbi:MAG: hypothetical protein J7M34_01805 [Anaerolineae bacterium]|nr:hypothetical protein [Anaerolineae bacterium]